MDELENALEAERSENKKKNTELLVKTKRLESLEETRAEILLKKSQAEAQVLSLTEELNLEQNKHRALQLSFNELENYNKELEEHKAVLEESLSQEKETGEELRKELEASKAVLESMQMKEIEFLDQEKELRLQNDSLTSQNKDLKDKVEMIEQEINTRKEFYKKTVREYETKISEYKAKIDEAYSEIKNLKNEMATMQKDHHSQTKSLEDKLALVGRAESEKLETLSKREEKLNYYSRWIDIQKQNLQSHVLTLANEMKTSLEINPLKTYLKITEKEISNMKVALSKMMAFDPNKPQAEMQYEQLILQRDEVQEALNKLSVEVESRVSNLKNMLKSSEFVPTPPLPPQK